MIRIVAALLALMALGSCPRAAPTIVTVAAPDLETAAVLRGLVRDPRESDPVGLYARDTDRLCVVRDGGGYRVGASIDYGEGLGCSGMGRLRRSGDRLGVDLGGGCTFDAAFDGDRITFPTELPDACARLCSRRATLAALDVPRLSGTAAEAATMRDARGRQPCG